MRHHPPTFVTASLRALVFLLTVARYFPLTALASSTTSGVSMSSESNEGGLSPQDFDSIVYRECNLELSSLTPEESTAKWTSATREAWSAFTATSDPFPPFVVCDSTPGLSGYKRQMAIKALFEASCSDVQLPICGVQFDATAIYNDSSKTCFVISSPGIVAKSVLTTQDDAASSTTTRSVSAPQYLKIQPLLPMMKISAFTVETAKTQLASATSVYKDDYETSVDGLAGCNAIQIMVMFAPGTLSNNIVTTTAAESATVERIMQSIWNRGPEMARSQLLDGFPFTGPSLLSMSAAPVDDSVATTLSEYGVRSLRTQQQKLQPLDKQSRTRRQTTNIDPVIEIQSQIDFALMQGGDSFIVNVNLGPRNCVANNSQTDIVIPVTLEAILSLVSGLAAQKEVSAVEVLNQIQFITL